jgi:hypothetical protein
MKRRSFWRWLLVATATVVVGVLSAGAAVVRAETPYHGQVAGLADTGTVYVTSPNDFYWHLIDPVTFVKEGYTQNDIQWYGLGGLPGSIAPDTVVTQPYQAFAELVRPPVNLMGLMSTGGVYIAPGDGTFHPVTAGDFVKNGYSWSWVKWFGELPGSVAVSW